MFKFLLLIGALLPLLSFGQAPVDLLLDNSQSIQRISNGQPIATYYQSSTVPAQRVFYNCDGAYYTSIFQEEIGSYTMSILKNNSVVYTSRYDYNTGLPEGVIFNLDTIQADSDGNIYITDVRNIYKISKTPVGYSEPEIIYQVSSYYQGIQRVRVDCNRNNRWYALLSEEFYSNDGSWIETYLLENGNKISDDLIPVAGHYLYHLAIGPRSQVYLGNTYNIFVYQGYSGLELLYSADSSGTLQKKAMTLPSYDEMVANSIPLWEKSSSKENYIYLNTKAGIPVKYQIPRIKETTVFGYQNDFIIDSSENIYAIINKTIYPQDITTSYITKNNQIIYDNNTYPRINYFTVIPQLMTTDYKQTDGQAGGIAFGNRIIPEDSTHPDKNKTFSRLGCLISAFANLINYYLPPSLPKITPLKLHEKLIEINGFTPLSADRKEGNDPIYKKISDASVLLGGPRLTIKSIGTYKDFASFGGLNEVLWNGQPTIVATRGGNATYHFVLALNNDLTQNLNGLQSTYRINDPSPMDFKHLNQYNIKENTTDGYYGRYITVSASYAKNEDMTISFHAGYDVEMSLEGEDGKKVGIINGEEFRDFPYSFYAQNSVGSLDEDISEKASLLQTMNLPSQKYRITFKSDSDSMEEVFINFSQGETIREQKTLTVNLRAGVPQEYEIIINSNQIDIPEFDPISSSPPERAFIRGDYNFDGKVNLTDSAAILSYILQGQRSSCDDTLDINDDGKIDVADYLLLSSYILTKLPHSKPAPPFPNAGIDPTEDNIPCN